MKILHKCQISFPSTSNGNEGDGKDFSDEFSYPASYILTEPELYAQLIKRTVPLGNSPKLEGNGLLFLTVEDYLSDVFNQHVTITNPI